MDEIILTQKKWIRMLIRKMTGGYNEDLEQEVFVKIFENMPVYQEQGKFSHWVGVITKNVCRDYFKSHYFKEIILNSVPVETEGSSVVSLLDVEETLSQKDRQKAILRAVDQLPKKLRVVIQLYEFENLPYEHIAKRLKIPVGTVRSRLFTARRLLSVQLKYLKGE